MSKINHHIPDELLAAYAAGNLPHAFSLVVAAHVSVCPECRSRLHSHEALGGLLMDEGSSRSVSNAMRQRVFACLDDAPVVDPGPRRMGVYPGPIAEVLHYEEPRWRWLGGGVRQAVLQRSDQESVRLLYIPAGQAMPDHGHHGLEMTMVLQGAFSDEFGHFGVGDVEMADPSLEHTPIAAKGEDCICIAAADARLRFNALVPRLLQPVFGI